MQLILLSQGMVALVDDSDFETLSKTRWCVKDARGKLYAVHVKRVRGTKNKTNHYMHRVVSGAQRGEYVDHINGDTLDNRRSNLRICTATQNQANKVTPKNNTSGYKGVVWNKSSKDWEAHIRVNGVCHRLGHFTSKEEAARVYNQAAVEYFGEFAKPNVI